MRYRQLCMYGCKTHLVVIDWNDDYDEYVCKLYERLGDGLLRPLGQHDYYTDDEDDARETAKEMLKEVRNDIEDEE